MRNRRKLFTALSLLMLVIPLTPARSQDIDGAESGDNRLDPAAIESAIDAIRKDDVAWRKIPWKTCLLDGIKASREQRKPIMLWIFIDRPIDDERC